MNNMYKFLKSKGYEICYAGNKPSLVYGMVSKSDFEEVFKQRDELLEALITVYVGMTAKCYTEEEFNSVEKAIEKANEFNKSN